MYLSENKDRVEEGEEVVVLVRVLADDVNRGYHTWSGWVVDSVNGNRVKDLKDLIQNIEAPSKSGFIVFSGERNMKLVLDQAKAHAALPDILTRYRIPADRSEDLK